MNGKRRKNTKRFSISNKTKLNFNGGINMKLIKKKAEFVGYVVYSVGAFPEWRCPDKDCGMSVIEEYKYCPYCGRRLKFDKSKK